VTGKEAFEFAAAIAGVAVGLTSITILAVVGVVGVWQLFRRANEASAATTRAALGAEELARHVATQLMAQAQPRGTSNGGQFADLRHQAEALLEQQRELHELTRSLVDTAATEGGAASADLTDVEMAINRLDSTVGQMAASLANLIQLLERRG
jgi:hypothetical protein